MDKFDRERADAQVEERREQLENEIARLLLALKPFDDLDRELTRKNLNGGPDCELIRVRIGLIRAAAQAARRKLG